MWNHFEQHIMKHICTLCTHIWQKASIYSRIRYLHHYSESYKFAQLILWWHWCVYNRFKSSSYKTLQMIQYIFHQGKKYLMIWVKVKTGVCFPISSMLSAISQDKQVEWKMYKRTVLHLRSDFTCWHPPEVLEGDQSSLATDVFNQELSLFCVTQEWSLLQKSLTCVQGHSSSHCWPRSRV